MEAINAIALRKGGIYLRRALGRGRRVTKKLPLARVGAGAVRGDEEATGEVVPLCRAVSRRELALPLRGRASRSGAGIKRNGRAAWPPAVACP